jgi:hypothetical protein
MSYDQLGATELQGTTQADYMVGLDARLLIVSGSDTVYEEWSFPVVELARALREWLDDADRRDFEFDSMSFEERGAVYVHQVEHGWRFGSVFSPQSESGTVDWAESERCIRSFLAVIEHDLRALGLDPAQVLRSSD